MSGTGWRIRKNLDADYILSEKLILTQFEGKLLHSLIEELIGISGQGSQPISAMTAHKMLQKVCERLCPLLPKERAEIIEKLALLDIGGNGPFDLLLEDESLEEISAIGEGMPIRVYKRGIGWQETNCEITSTEYAISCINRMARPLGRRITLRDPLINARLGEGSRLHASIAPANGGEFEITLRKYPNNPMHMLELVRNGCLPVYAAAFLWLAAFGDTSIAIAGNTGSGKTTFLNSLFSFVPLSDRIVIVEETPELRIPQPHRVSLVEDSSAQGKGMEALARTTLRMRPDRAIIGEVRTPSEASALFESLSAGGAKGTYATFHAKNAKEALTRLKHLGIHAGEISAIDLIVIIRRHSIYGKANKRQAEERLVWEIAQIGKKGKIEDLFSININTGKLTPDNEAIRKSSIIRKLTQNYRMDEETLMFEIEERARFLESLANEGKMNFEEFTGRITEYMFGKSKMGKLGNWRKREGNQQEA